MESMMDAVECLIQYFRDSFMPRNHGVIGVVELKQYTYCLPAGVEQPSSGLLVTLVNQPFLQLIYAPGQLLLTATYPAMVAVWNIRTNQWERGSGRIGSFPRNPRARNSAVRALVNNAIRGQVFGMDIAHPESIQRIEFYMHAIITKIKYMVSTLYPGVRQLKADLEFPDLIEFAMLEYEKKVSRKITK